MAANSFKNLPTLRIPLIKHIIIFLCVDLTIPTEGGNEEPSSNLGLIIGLSVGGFVVLCLVVFVVVKVFVHDKAGEGKQVNILLL